MNIFDELESNQSRKRGDQLLRTRANLLVKMGLGKPVKPVREASPQRWSALDVLSQVVGGQTMLNHIEKGFVDVCVFAVRGPEMLNLRHRFLQLI